MKISDFREKSIRFDTTQHTTKKQCDAKSLTVVSFFVKKQSRKPKPKFRTTSFSQEEKRKQNLFFSLLVLYDNQHPFPFLVRHQNHIK